MSAASKPDTRLVANLLGLVSPAETAFRSRWRLGTLARLNADLHAALVEQIDLFNTAMVTGTDQEAKLQAEAMVRGWRAACAALEAPLVSDDAYLTGFDSNTGTRVVISDQQASIGRVQRVGDSKVVMVTPDEVARMVAGMTIIAEAKRLFPDAEVMEIQAPNPLFERGR